MVRVFVTHNPEDLEAYYGRALPALREIADVVVNDSARDLTTAELIDAAEGCEVIVAHRATAGEPALFDQRPELLALLRTAVDISTIDVAAASAAGVLVAHADKSFVASTAELALALMLDTSRHVSDSTVDYRLGNQPRQLPGRQLRGRTAGIIGLGSIGTYLGEALQALGVRVLAHDPYVEQPTVDGVTLVDLDQLLGECDFVIPLAASTPETADLIGTRELSLMKPDAILINVSRGELLDEDAVTQALDRGRLGGLGLDVGRGPDQRPSPDLAARPGVVATPHLGGLTPENADAQAASSVEQVAAIVAGSWPPRSVNPADAHRLRRWWAER